MKASWLKKVTVAVLSVLLLMLPISVSATNVTSNAQSTALSLTINESVTLTASPASVNFTYSGDTATASSPITLTASWFLASGRTAVNTYAWFSTPSAALSSGTNNIPNSQVFESTDGGAANPCTGFSTAAGITGGACGVGGNDSFISTDTVPPQVGNNSHTMALTITGVSTMNPGTYTGVLNELAIAF